MNNNNNNEQVKLADDNYRDAYAVADAARHAHYVANGTFVENPTAANFGAMTAAASVYMLAATERDRLLSVVKALVNNKT